MYLRPYANPDTPYVQSFRFDRESCDKMLAKTKVLTNYEPEIQHQVQFNTYHQGPVYHQPGRAMTSPLPLAPIRTQVQSMSPRGQDYSPRTPYSPRSYSDEGSVVGSEYSGLSPILQSDFGGAQIEDEMSNWVPRKRPPDQKLKKMRSFIIWILKRAFETLCRIGTWFRGR